jgi:hypothetical protein
MQSHDLRVTADAQLGGTKLQGWRAPDYWRTFLWGDDAPRKSAEPTIIARYGQVGH